MCNKSAKDLDVVCLQIQTNINKIITSLTKQRLHITTKYGYDRHMIESICMILKIELIPKNILKYIQVCYRVWSGFVTFRKQQAV